MKTELLTKYEELNNLVTSIKTELNEAENQRNEVLKNLHAIVGEEQITISGKKYKIAKRGETYFLFDMSVKRGRAKKSA